MAFLDVRVFNPFAKTHLKSKLETVFKGVESKKKTDYNERVIAIEHGSFTPIIASAGFGRESSRFLKEFINKIAEKHDLSKSSVANYVRTKLSFVLVRAQNMCLRGSRSRFQMNVEVKESEVVDCLSEIRR